MKYLTLLKNLFSSRVFYMLGMFVLFVCVALENVMQTAGATLHLNLTAFEKIFMVIPASLMFLLVSAFLVVMKRSWADYSAIALLVLGLILHRPSLPLVHSMMNKGFLWWIYEFPFYYLFYPASVFLIVFLIFQIKNNNYRMSLK